jgi:FKBP-type peptidyl-prolyl cis-trans isomerase
MKALQLPFLFLIAPTALGFRVLSSVSSRSMIMSVLSASAKASTTTTTDAFTAYQPGQSTLAFKDKTVGQGESAQNGDTLKVSFVGRYYPSRKKFCTSDNFVFELGEGKTMPGFDVALRGSQVGTRRIIRVPPLLSFGKQGIPVRAVFFLVGTNSTRCCRTGIFIAMIHCSVPFTSCIAHALYLLATPFFAAPYSSQCS